MTDLFLIAHKVRNEPAFDVAMQMDCPHCAITFDDGVTDSCGCHECDSLGFWWIIPTSGHRAYPIMHWELNNLCHFIPEHEWQPNVITELGPIEANSAWPSLPDHYPTKATPKVSLIDALGIRPAPRPLAPIVRRF